jgi:Recombinase
VQGVIAEYERAKIAERYRRGKLFRSRAGEVIGWRTPYGYPLARHANGRVRLVLFEPEAAIVRRIFDDYTTGGHSTREIVRRLHADGVASPKGQRPIWGTSTISRILHNEAHIGRTSFNRTESVSDHRPGRRSKQVPRRGRQLALAWVAGVEHLGLFIVWLRDAGPAVSGSEAQASAGRSCPGPAWTRFAVNDASTLSSPR